MPIASTTASQYNVGTYYQNCSDIGLAQSIRTVTATVLGTLLAAKFFPGNATMQQAATTVCRDIANQLKAKGETMELFITQLLSTKPVLRRADQTKLFLLSM